MKYVKKPIIVEAFQFGVDETPKWAVFDKHGMDSGSYSYLRVAGGQMWVRPGDMVIRGDNMMHACVKKDIFDATYDLVETEKPWKYPVIGSEQE